MQEEMNGKKIYLTFDDGPSEYTGKLLAVLKKHNVKATFFVTHEQAEYEDMIKKADADGHTIGAHCFSHEYSVIYAGTDAYFDDLSRIMEVIRDQTGHETKYVRVPGGSSNTISNMYQAGIMDMITEQLSQKGFCYFDWNVCGEDNNETDPQKILGATMWDIMKMNTPVVLFHDTKPDTAAIVDRLICWGQTLGYSFQPIGEDTPVVQHKIASGTPAARKKEYDIERILEKAASYIGTEAVPPERCEVIFNEHYYGKKVSGPEYPWCVVFIWDIFRMCGLSEFFYDGNKTDECDDVARWAKEKGLLVPDLVSPMRAVLRRTRAQKYIACIVRPGKQEIVK